MHLKSVLISADADFQLKLVCIPGEVGGLGSGAKLRNALPMQLGFEPATASQYIAKKHPKQKCCILASCVHSSLTNYSLSAAAEYEIQRLGSAQSGGLRRFRWNRKPNRGRLTTIVSFSGRHTFMPGWHTPRYAATPTLSPRSKATLAPDLLCSQSRRPRRLWSKLWRSFCRRVHGQRILLQQAVST